MPASIIQDHLVQNLAAEDASPSKEILMGAIEFFKSHNAITPGAVHRSLL
jgi:hypothetical protein